MNDLTIVYLTANQMPQHWMNFQIETLERAIHKLNIPIISISRQPFTLGNNYIDTDRRGYWNIYRQLLRGAEIAKTKYIAMAEDDTLYCKQHFTEFRPKDNEVSYNRSRWSLFCWEKDPLFCLRQRVSNCSLIGPRELIIESLKERINKHPDGDDLPNSMVGEIGRNRIESLLNVTKRKMVEWWSTTAVVQLNHPDGIDILQQKQHKSHGQLKAYVIPYWGEARDLVRYYYE